MSQVGQKTGTIHYDQRRWLVLLASCLVNLCVGSIYAWSVFSSPLAGHLSQISGTILTPANLAIVFTVANAVGPITLISGGWINDRIGPKLVILVGGILFGTGMIISSYATSIGMLVAGYGLCCGLAMGLAYGCAVNNTVKFFPDRRGLAGGLTTASYGLSSVLVPLVANGLIEGVGIARCLWILGIVFTVIIALAVCFIEVCPAGYCPQGYQAAQKTGAVERDCDYKMMLRHPLFYVMIVMLCCGAFFGLMLISQASPIAQRMIGMSTMQATLAVSVLALFNTGGRVVCGVLSDKLGRIPTLRGIFVLAAVGLGLLLMADTGDVVLFYGGMSVVGLCFGAFMGILPGFTADVFGAKHNSVNYGIMFIGFSVAGIFGPMLMSRCYTATGSDTQALLLAVVLALCGLGLTFAYTKVDTVVKR